jgi:hypothetical protein
VVRISRFAFYAIAFFLVEWLFRWHTDRPLKNWMESNEEEHQGHAKPRTSEAIAGYFPDARSAESWSRRRAFDFKPNDAIPPDTQRNPIRAKIPIITTATI